MIRRTCVISVFVFVVFALLAAPALAYGPVIGSTLFPHARLVAGADPAMVAWPASGDTSLVAVRYTDAGPGTPSRTIVSGIGALGAWYATGHGTR